MNGTLQNRELMHTTTTNSSPPGRRSNPVTRPERGGVGGPLILPTAILLASLATGCSEPRGEKRQTLDRTGKASTSADSKGAANDWCIGHKLPESKCTKCNPGLVAKYKKAGDWCSGHGFPESVCPNCNPVSPPSAAGTHTKAPKDWCTGHGLPESKCTQCNPKLVEKFRSEGDWCVTHGFPASACPKCSLQTPPAGTTIPPVVPPGTRIRFRTASIERAAGITAVPAVKASLGHHVFCTARIEYNRNQLAEIRSPVPALVQHVLIDLGSKVRKGAKLFTLSSAQIGVLKARLIAAGRRFRVAKADLKRQKALQKGGGASIRDVELAHLRLAEASSTLASISQSLRVGGISARGFSGSFTLLAPISGTVVQRPAVLGTKAGPGTALATLADMSSMWAMLEVNEWDAALVLPGRPVTVRVDGLAGQVFEGKITWVSTEVNPRTRFVRARAEIENPRGLLRANQFARATLSVSAPRGDVAVPLESVQKLGNGQVIFVRLKEGVYEPRSVVLGRTDGMRVHVTGQVKVGDAVVTTGAFLLRTELSKDAIGAGCCEVEKPGGK